MSDAADAVFFPNALAGLATRLAAAGLAIYSVEYSYLSFGSWVIEAGRRHKRVRVTWDGKEARLEVFHARVGSNSDHPQWQAARTLDFADRTGEYVAIFEATYAAIITQADV